MSGPDAVDTGAPSPPWRHRDERGRHFLQRLSDRTPLRTKLITAVLALVIMALAVISVASIYMVRAHLITQHDQDLSSALSFTIASNTLPHNVPVGYAAPTQSNVIEGIQDPGSQLAWGTYNLPGTGNLDPLPQLPTSGLWPGSKVGSTTPVFSVPAQSGPNTWRIMAETVIVRESTGAQSTAVLVVAEDLGNINGLTTRLVLFDLAVGAAIVLVLAAVGAAAVRANLRPLNDIELSAGQIAQGHLDHR